jgi:hypothetical protein
MTHCTYHVSSEMQASVRESPKFSANLEDRTQRTELHYSIPGCHVVAVEYDIERKQLRKCYRCGGKITTTDDGTLTVKRCSKCKRYDNRKYRLAKIRRLKQND